MDVGSDYSHGAGKIVDEVQQEHHHHSGLASNDHRFAQRHRLVAYPWEQVVGEHYGFVSFRLFDLAAGFFVKHRCGKARG